MLELEDIWSEESSKQKLKKFDETLRSLRRQFRKLLKEGKKSKDSVDILNLSRQNSNTPEKANGSSDCPKATSELSFESRKDIDDVSMNEDNSTSTEKKIPTSNLQTPKKSEKTFTQDDIPEILSVDFDSDSEQSLLDQLERSKSTCSTSENQLQKSPVFCKNRIKGKKSQSPRVNVTSCEFSRNADKAVEKIDKGEPVTECQKYVHENVKQSLATTKSLFTFKEKEYQIFVSPQPKPSQKLGITKLYNVNTQVLSNGKKLKQTKLVFTAEEEKTDTSNAANFINQAINGTCDSIFDSTLFHRNADLENMEINVENPLLSTKSTIVAKKNLSSPKKVQVLDEDDFVEISPTKENRKLKLLKKPIKVSKKSCKISKSPQKNKADKEITLRSNENFFKPQACSTQISLQESQVKCNEGMVQGSSNSDSDTDFSFNEEHAVLKNQFPSSVKKTILANVSKKSPHFKQKCDINHHINQKSHVEATETALDDETFFSPGEYQNDIFFGENAKPSTSGKTDAASPKSRRVLLSSFDRIPEKRKRSPDYAYVVQSVRRKSERAQLAGWACWNCKKYYESLNLPEKELKEHMKKCSRHKAKFDPEYHTPPDFWNPAFSDTFAPTLCGLENK